MKLEKNFNKILAIVFLTIGLCHWQCFSTHLSPSRYKKGNCVFMAKTNINGTWPISYFLSIVTFVYKRISCLFLNSMNKEFQKEHIRFHPRTKGKFLCLQYCRHPITYKIFLLKILQLITISFWIGRVLLIR